MAGASEDASNENARLRNCAWSQFVKYVIGGYSNEGDLLDNERGVQCVYDVLELGLYKKV